MGCLEGIELNIGIRIQLCKLIPQINKSNFKDILKICSDGIMEKDGYHMYKTLKNKLIEKYTKDQYYYLCRELDRDRRSNSESDEGESDEDHIKFKEEFMVFAKNRGTFDYSDDSTYPQETFENGSLYEQYILYPFSEIMQNSHPSYRCEYAGGTSCNVDDCNIDEKKKKITEKYHWLFDFEIVFILNKI